MNDIEAFKDRLNDISILADHLRTTLAEIQRASQAGRRPVSLLTLAKSFVAVDEVASRLAWAANELGNGTDPAALIRDSLKDK